MDYEKRRQAIIDHEGWEEYRDSPRRRGGGRTSGPQARRPASRRGNRLLAGLLAVLTAAVLVTGGLRLAGRSVDPEEVEARLPEYVAKDLLPENPWSRPGLPLEEVRGVVLHYVGNPGTSAQANRNYFASLADGAEGVYASSHFIVGLEGEVLQCVPLTEIAYASNRRNDDTLSVEVCHPGEDGQYGAETYRRVVELTAWLCREFRLDPQKDLIRHYDVTGKRCPLYYVEHPEAWDQLRNDVEAEMQAQAERERT